MSEVTVVDIFVRSGIIWGDIGKHMRLLVGFVLEERINDVQVESCEWITIFVCCEGLEELKIKRLPSLPLCFHVKPP